jgi:hypothetical protein
VLNSVLHMDKLIRVFKLNIMDEVTH